MRYLILFLAMIGAAHGQTQDWVYSDLVTGTQVTDSGTNAYSGTLTGTIVLNGSGANETLTYNFSAPTPAGQFQLQGYELLASPGAATGWIVPVTNGQGVVTGFNTTAALNDSPVSYNGYTSSLSIENGATSMQWLASVGDCSNNINCTINASGTGGVSVDPPTAAPEFGPAWALGLTLLLSGIAILMSREA
jgi:hypothetical protein